MSYDQLKALAESQALILKWVDKDGNDNHGRGDSTAVDDIASTPSSKLQFESHTDKKVNELNVTQTREALAHANVAEAVLGNDPDAYVGPSHSRAKLTQRLVKLTGKTKEQLQATINSDADAIGSKI